MKEVTLVMAKELTAQRLYADLLRARLYGTVVHQRERLDRLVRIIVRACERSV